MRIGNSPFNPLSDRQETQPVRKPAATQDSPETGFTTDLMAMSAGIGMLADLTETTADRAALIQKLAGAWQSGAYKPDVERLSSKLLDSGFDLHEGFSL